MMTTPNGWTPCPIPHIDPIAGKPHEAFTNGKHTVVLGTPLDESEDPKCELHDCDLMGCGWNHVLARVEN